MLFLCVPSSFDSCEVQVLSSTPRRRSEAWKQTCEPPRRRAVLMARGGRQAVRLSVLLCPMLAPTRDSEIDWRLIDGPVRTVVTGKADDRLPIVHCNTGSIACHDFGTDFRQPLAFSAVL